MVNLSPVVADDPYQSQVNDISGVVSGHINVYDPNDDELSYTLTSEIDPAVGKVTVNPTTGGFAFVPTPEARREAFSSQTEQTVKFTISASDGHESVTVEVTATISPSEGHPDDDGTLEPTELLDLVTDGTVEVVQNDDGTVRVIDGTFTDDAVRNRADAAEVFNRIAELLGAPRVSRRNRTSLSSGWNNRRRKAPSRRSSIAWCSRSTAYP